MKQRSVNHQKYYINSNEMVNEHGNMFDKIFIQGEDY